MQSSQKGKNEKSFEKNSKKLLTNLELCCIIDKLAMSGTWSLKIEQHKVRKHNCANSCQNTWVKITQKVIEAKTIALKKVMSGGSYWL